jgi:tRNA pseudouridine13 synthase
VSNFSAVLHPLRAYGAPLGLAQLRAIPEDFCVREWLGFEADGEGDHWLLKVRKRDANTLWVAKQLARIGNAHPKDVGFAGIKDRHALTEQSFAARTR